MINNTAEVIHRLEQFARIYKRKLLLDTLIRTLPWLVIILVSGYYLAAPLAVLIGFSIVIFIIRYLLCINSALYERVNKENLALHLNRQYPQLHESAQLLFRFDAELSLLQKLQKKRVLSTLNTILISDEKTLLPSRSTRKPLILLTVVLCAVITLPAVNKHWFSHSPLSPSISVEEHQQASQSIVIESSDITIVPPGYSELPSVVQQDLNLNVLVGSKVRWKLNFIDKSLHYFLIFSDQTRVALTQQSDLSYVYESDVVFTQIYRIVSDELTLDNIFTITVNPDNKPTIRILTPKQAVTTLAKNHQEDIATRVKIADDFALSNVEILASIAKGSGESVKFRDQTFFFDRIEFLAGEAIYHKKWQLSTLGMEPGDELYFTVKAWDNRKPKPQMTQSTTKIIRWLEEDGEGVLSDGILIDFMPAYFKSQRQIIIDTIELIEDKNEMSERKFIETSELLGVAQSALKEKYGQYLGDEVDDGSASHVVSDQAAHGIEESTQSDEHDDDKQGNHHVEEHDSEEHGNDEFEMSAFGVDKSGLTEQIKRFGHSHEAGDIGIMARQDPKALMKRSIANMWEAELHLMLSNPSKALPFEQEALKYLKMAKKAERIYVKRLGFEPPPVTEQRRYQGELSDIENNTQHQELAISNTEQKTLSRAFKLLNGYLNGQSYGQSKSLSVQEQQVFKKAKVQFAQQVDNRPALIKYLAILERILLKNNLHLPECSTCINELSYKVWQLIPLQVATPAVSKAAYNNNEGLVRKYALYLREQELLIKDDGAEQ